MKTFLLLFVLCLVSRAVSSPLTDEVDPLIARSIPLISPGKLAEEIEEGKRIVLLDTRQPGELKVSHIFGAHWVGFREFDQANLPVIAKDSPIIVYCSVGYRSKTIGEKLKAAGYTNVRNLKGGIFAWANQSRTLEDAEGGATRIVHGYDRKWAKLLAPEVPVTLEKLQR